MNKDLKAIRMSYEPSNEKHLTVGAVGNYYEGVVSFSAKIISKREEDGWLYLTIQPLEKNEFENKPFEVGKKEGYEGYCGWSFHLDVERN
jgi:intein/homing endonuclease